MSMPYLIMFLILTVSPATASGPREHNACLSSEEVQSLVVSNKAVSSAKAVRAARPVVPNAELLRTRLCMDGDKLQYRITFLRRDGRIVPVTIDATSGNVMSSQ
jgi:uncharacterized membrane protein YkoI